MTEAIRVKIAEEVSNKELVSNNVKPTSICGLFLKTGKCYRTKCKFSHKINTEEKSEELLQLNSKKKISEENLRKRQGNSEFINSATNATEIKQSVASEMSGEQNTIKEETQKRPGDHSDEVCYIPSNWMDKCQPTYCGVCFISLTKNHSRNHYAGKPHKKKLKLLDKERHPNNYTCSLCKVTTSSKVTLEIHRQGLKHKSKEAQKEVLRAQKEAQKEVLRDHSGTEEVKTNKLSGKNSFFCDVCHVSATSEDSFKQHLTGKPHAKKLIMTGWNKPSFLCEVCGWITVDNKSLEWHLWQHRAQVAKKEKGNKSGIKQTKAYSEKVLNLVSIDAKDTEKIEMSNKRKIKVEVEETKKIKVEVYCLLCQMYGHIISKECVARVRCLDCGIEGHIRRDCINSENEYVEKEIPKDEPNNDVTLECDSNATGIKKDVITSLNTSQEYMEDKKKIKLEVYCILCQTHDHIFSEACVSNAICCDCGVKGHVGRDCKEEKCDLKNIKLEVKKET